MSFKAPPTVRIDALFALATLAATAVAAGVAAAPHLMHHEPSAEERAALVEERATRAKELNSQVEAVTQRLAKLQGETDRAVQLQPAAAANTRLQELTATADRHGATISQIRSLTPDTQDPRATIIPVRISGAATYTQATAFLSELRKQFPDMGVTAFKIEGSPTTVTPPPAAVFSVELAWYAAPANSAPTSASSAGRAGSAGSAGSAGTSPKSP